MKILLLIAVCLLAGCSSTYEDMTAEEWAIQYWWIFVLPFFLEGFRRWWKS